MLQVCHVRLLLDDYSKDNPANVYTVLRVLPTTANVWQCRVKRGDDIQERAVSERQLAKATQQRSMAEMQQDAGKIRNARASERARVVARRFEPEQH